MVTIKDIAREAKVSHPTVSLVLNGRAKQLRISDEVAQLVRSTAKKLGYTRNEIARSMVTGKTEIIAFVAAAMGLAEYTGRIQNGVLNETSAHDYSLKVYCLNPAEQVEIARKLVAQRVAGVIFHAEKFEDFAIIHEELAHRDIPSAVVNLSNVHGVGITSDDRQGATDAVAHLVGLGHRRIAHIAHKNSDEYVVNRRLGYLEGMKQISQETPLLLSIPEYKTSVSDEVSWIRSALRKCHECGISAFFCSEDTIAMRVLQAAYELDIKVPDALSIVGFGNMDMGRFAVVPLTSVEQPFEEIGKLATSKIIESAGDNSMPKIENVKLKTKLVIRESTSQPASVFQPKG